MEKDPLGYFTVVLHAHLPFVREPAHERFLEENWFYEALTETYLPLLSTFDGLIRDGVDFRVTMSLTPTLLSMFEDDLLRERYESKLDQLIELCEKEEKRGHGERQFYELARFYRERFMALRDFYFNRCGRDMVGAFRRLQDAGYVEILTSAATHGFLPLLRHEPDSVRAQVRVAVDHYRSHFGRQPEGMWLPECGYYPGLDEVLAEAGIRYFFIESHGALYGSHRPHYGVYAPIICPSGVAAFARDPECAKQVWSVREGFPGAPDYREFYRDIGFDLPLDYIGPYVGPDGNRVQTGIKYYRVTGQTDQKEPYVRERAMNQAAQHAQQFLEWRQKQMEWLSGQLDRRPIIVAPYDAELFGHWWFEGPDWLNFLLRKIAFDQSTIVTATPSEYLAENPDSQLSTPAASSWGERGYNQVWINESNDWVISEVLQASGEMSRLAFVHRGAGGTHRRYLNQAAREILLAQSSDWPFMLKNETTTEYATDRVKEHLRNFRRLVADVESAARGDQEGSRGKRELAEHQLAECEHKNNLFPEIDFEVFAAGGASPGYALQAGATHVAFITAEAAPYVKVGGLADVAAALPPALGRWGTNVTLILPAYRSIDWKEHEVRPLQEGLQVSVGGRNVEFGLLEARSPTPRVRVILVGQDEYFGRDGVYVDPKTGEEYADAGERFVFFTRAALEALKVLGVPVDIVHSHDHQTALASAFLKFHYADDPILGLAASVYTLHNLGYQGVYGPAILALAGFGMDRFYAGSPFEHFGKVNFMKLGICCADKVNTVSQNYAREICSDEGLGAGLGEVLRTRGADFQGILNGIDVDEWNPAEDPYLPQPYSVDDMSGKRLAKERLFELVELDRKRLDHPLIGMITRLVDQKGLDLVHDALGRVLSLGTSLVVLGTGLPKYEEFFRGAAKRYKGQVAALIKFDNGLAHQIEAGADMFLMPSLYEPCGLNQMYSLRYGTVPIVRATGGLADTVVDDDESSGNGVGFCFTAYEPEAMIDAVRRAVTAYGQPERWQDLRRRAMERDHSWGASALKYYDLYRAALRDRRSEKEPSGQRVV